MDIYQRAEKLQRKSQPKYRKQQKNKEEYIKAKRALFARRMADEITLDEYLAGIQELMVKHGIRNE